MDKNKLEKIGINVTDGLRRMNNNETFYEKLLVYFVNDTNYDVLEQAIKAKNYEEAFTACHTLKGVVGNLSMVELFDKTSKLTEALRHKEYDKVDDLFKLVKTSYENVVKVLKEVLNV